MKISHIRIKKIVRALEDTPFAVIKPTGTHMLFGDFSAIQNKYSNSRKSTITIVGWSAHGIIRFTSNPDRSHWSFSVIPELQSFIQIGHKKTFTSSISGPWKLAPLLCKAIFYHGGSIVAYLRPCVFYTKNTTVILTQKQVFSFHRGKIVPSTSIIEMRSSTPTNRWSKPTVLFDAHEFQNVSSPCVFYDGSQYILYFTHGILETGTSFMEPKFLAFATSRTMTGPFTYKGPVTIVNAKTGKKWEHCGSLRIKTIGRGKTWIVANQIIQRPDGSTQSMAHTLERIGTDRFIDNGHFLTHEQRTLIHATDVYVADLIGDDMVALNARVSKKPHSEHIKPARNIIESFLLLVRLYRYYSENMYLYRMRRIK